MGADEDNEPLVEPRGDAAVDAPDSPPTSAGGAAKSQSMLPTRGGRSGVERTFVRIIATGGIVGLSVGIAAIMAEGNAQGWLIGLVVSLVSVVLAAVLWSSRVL